MPDDSDRSRDRSPWGSCSIRAESSLFVHDRCEIVLDRSRSSRARQINRDSRKNARADRKNARADRCGDRIRRPTVRVLIVHHRLPIVDSRLNSRAPLAHSIAILLAATSQ